MSDPFDLDRFVAVQAPLWPAVREELAGEPDPLTLEALSITSSASLDETGRFPRG